MTLTLSASFMSHVYGAVSNVCPEKYFLLGTALHAAVIGDQLEILRYLLEISVDVRQKAVSLDLFCGRGLIDETATQTAVRATEDIYS